ncbi:unnamed protein product [Brachionus calyciflorus]|uniref:CCHC-type domain-containing protein n=1 Tax=Brachionus calyciflorus TaxID=104777 RepID=A0A814HKI2_9BILA|nr:unnamed protein product [Brachionus calyciflorus]
MDEKMQKPFTPQPRCQGAQLKRKPDIMEKEELKKHIQESKPSDLGDSDKVTKKPSANKNERDENMINTGKTTHSKATKIPSNSRAYKAKKDAEEKEKVANDDRWTNRRGNQEIRRQILEELENKEIENYHMETDENMNLNNSNEEKNTISQTIEEVINNVMGKINDQSSINELTEQTDQTRDTNDNDALSAQEKTNDNVTEKSNTDTNDNPASFSHLLDNPRRWENEEGTRNDLYLTEEQKKENTELEKKYPRQKYEVIIKGEGLKNFNNIYVRLKEIKRCTGIENPINIQPVYDEEKTQHYLIIGVNTNEEYGVLTSNWPIDAFEHGVQITDKPPNLNIIINNIDKNLKIDPNDKQIKELTRQYGIIDVERIYGQDKSPSNKIKGKVLTLFNFIDLLKNGIHFDATSMKHTVKPSINFAKVCYKCGNLNHNQKYCKNKERCLKCGEFDHLMVNCKNSAKCLNCDGNHQFNSDACDILTDKTLLQNKYLLDIMVQEKIIESKESIFKVPKTSKNKTNFIDDKEGLENIINVILDEKLKEKMSTKNQRLEYLENTAKAHSKEINDVKLDINSIKTDIKLFKDLSNNNHNETHKLLTEILNRIPCQLTHHASQSQ